MEQTDTKLQMVYEKLSDNLIRFRQNMMRQSKKKIYESCYEIDIIQNIYDTLMANVEHYPEKVWDVIINEEQLLEILYQEWLDTDDSFWDELDESIKNGLHRQEIQIRNAG